MAILLSNANQSTKEVCVILISTSLPGPGAERRLPGAPCRGPRRGFRPLVAEEGGLALGVGLGLAGRSRPAPPGHRPAGPRSPAGAGGAAPVPGPAPAGAGPPAAQPWASIWRTRAATRWRAALPGRQHQQGPPALRHARGRCPPAAGRPPAGGQVQGQGPLDPGPVVGVQGRGPVRVHRRPGTGAGPGRPGRSHQRRTLAARASGTWGRSVSWSQMPLRYSPEPVTSTGRGSLQPGPDPGRRTRPGSAARSGGSRP